MLGLKYPPLKTAVNKKLPEVLLYKHPNAKIYKAIDTSTGKCIGYHDKTKVSSIDYSQLPLWTGVKEMFKDMIKSIF